MIVYFSEKQNFANMSFFFPFYGVCRLRQFIRLENKINNNNSKNHTILF